MLSKLDFFESSNGLPEEPDHQKVLRNALERKMPSAEIVPVEGGTLGVCFQTKIAGKRRFLKTHLPDGAARVNLAKEAGILRRLYGDQIVLDCFEVMPDGGTPRLCMMLAWLSPLPHPMQPYESAAMVRDFASELAHYRPAELSSAKGFSHYVMCAQRATALLTDRSLIHRQSAAQLERMLTKLHASLEILPKAICHGDLGPKNIMTDGVRNFVIDWEDAFEGIDGYDYLYWLTFMTNRVFLRTAALGQTNLDIETERAILALVVVLKSFLSVQANIHIDNKMSIEARIAEVLALAA